MSAQPRHYTLMDGRRVPYMHMDAIAERTAEAWAPRIRPHLEQAVEHIVAAGREIASAKAVLPRGEYGRLAELLGVTTRTMQRFVAIAEHPVLADATHVSHLPASWGTLYELSRMEPAKLEAAIEAGEVTPKLERNAAKQLVVHHTIETRREEREREGHPVQRAQREGRIRDQETLIALRDIIARFAGLAPTWPPQVVARTVADESEHYRRLVAGRIHEARLYLDELDDLIRFNAQPMQMMLADSPEEPASDALLGSLEAVDAAMSATWNAIAQVPKGELEVLTADLKRFRGTDFLNPAQIESDTYWEWWWFGLADGQWKDRMGVLDVLGRLRRGGQS